MSKMDKTSRINKGKAQVSLRSKNKKRRIERQCKTT